MADFEVYDAERRAAVDEFGEVFDRIFEKGVCFAHTVLEQIEIMGEHNVHTSRNYRAAQGKLDVIAECLQLFKSRWHTSTFWKAAMRATAKREVAASAAGVKVMVETGAAQARARKGGA